MARKWTTEERQDHFALLNQLYVIENKTIGEIGRLKKIPEQTIFKRLKMVGIQSRPYLKPGYLLHRRKDLVIPDKRTPELAEFFGIMLGDGKLSHYQVVVTLGTKEMPYANYVVNLIKRVFNLSPKIAIRKGGYKDVYFGSIVATKWLQQEGLVFNKVKSQVSVPQWIFTENVFMRSCLRGLFDTDGSIYKLRWGAQISFCNNSRPLIESVRDMLIKLAFHPSRISGHNIYLTRAADLDKFLQEIGFANSKHMQRCRVFRAGTQAVNEGTL